MLIATALTIMVTFNQFSTGPQMFNIPSEEINHSMYAFVVATRSRNWLWLSQHEYIQTQPVLGIFTPCEGLRQMLAGTSVEVMNAETGKLLCPPPPHKTRPHRIDTAPIIDPPARRHCDCLEISGIPIPWCENDEAQLMNAHECQK